MAEKNSELHDVALQIFAQGIGSHGVRPGHEEKAAVAAYRQADAFLAAKQKIDAGELMPKKPEGVTLAEYSAPNQKPTSPHNLVSQRFGNLAKVGQVKRWLDANPEPAGKDIEEQLQTYVAKFNRDFPGYGWGLPELHIAQSIFPYYIVKS